MRALRFALLLSAGSLLLASSAVAQEGHPLKGSWLGSWGPTDTHQNNVIVILDWDGENITGIINPGTDNIEIQEADLDPETWTLTFEATGEDSEGNAVSYSAEGTLDRIPFHDRTISGTWTHAEGSGPFSIQRQ
jgi:hypothetical protein